MALRVLLADESVTIKKVIQLALQDFAVEVKAVPVGLDVLEVSKSFHPDLVFADILLQKRSGYDVCADLKKDTATAAIPVVLMWSSFMELDQRQVDSCGADGKLEKPFEVEALRKLVLELVPRTRSQRLAHFLEYPPNISAPLKQEVANAGSKSQTSKPASAPAAPAAKPKMPPPLVVPPAGTKSPLKNPFASSLGAPVTSSPLIHKMPASDQREDSIETSDEKPDPLSDLTPVIPDRPDRALGALPDLQLEGTPTQPAAKSSGAESQWSMDSFAPMDLPPLSLEDDPDDAKESFQPIQLPQAEPSLKLTTEDDEADQWSNKSLDKYRLPPLKPDESLAIDERSPDFAGLETDDTPELSDLGSNEQTEIISAVHTKKSAAKKPFEDSADDLSNDDDIPNFTFEDSDFDKKAALEIEQIEVPQAARPDMIRELLKDPDFSSNDALEDMVRSQVAPHLEKMIQRIVGELLPPIAERIIKRELERLLEES